MSSIDKEIDQDKKTHKSTLIKVSVGLVLAVVTALLLYWITPLLLSGTSQTTSALPASNGQTAESAKRMSEQARSVLQQDLTAVKQQLSAMQPHERDWQSATVKALDESLETAYSLYGQGKFQNARSEVDSLSENLTAYETAFKNAYQAAYERAELAFNKGEIHPARAAIAASLQVKPNFDKALALKKRIDVFAQVQALYETARIGKTENNLQKQYQALSRLVTLDPEQETAQKQLVAIEQAIASADFSKTISQALSAVEAKQYDAARQLLKQASALKPQSPEILTLQTRIEQEQQAQGQAGLEAQVKVFAQADEWRTVKMLADKGLNTYPASQVLQLAAKNAAKLIAAETTLNDYLKRPERLSDSRIHDNARLAIESTKALAPLSATLQATISQLQHALADYSSPLPVTVYSDGKTLIKVLGVGVVGKVDEKTISLKPGNYRFEASREGYRSKIVSITVSQNALPVSVRLVCDQKV